MKTDVLIIGGGPGGPAAAMFLIKEGINPIIVEQEEFPRFHIGESMTGEAGALLRRLGFEKAMTARQYPAKHGVRVFGSSSWFIPVASRDENWQLQPASTWQVRRSDFDGMMLQEAQKRGAILVRGTAVKVLQTEGGAVCGITIRKPDGTLEDIGAKVVLDCSGMATFLANQKVTGPKYLGSYDKQIAFFAHIKGGIRDNGTSGEMAKTTPSFSTRRSFTGPGLSRWTRKWLVWGWSCPPRNSFHTRRHRTNFSAATCPRSIRSWLAACETWSSWKRCT